MRPLALLLLLGTSCSGGDAPPVSALPAGPRSWQPAGQVEDTARALVRLESVLLAAGDDGLVRSDDDGVSWVALEADGLPEGALTQLLPLGGDGVLAWVHGKGLSRSVDGGATFAPVGALPEQPLLQTLLNPRGAVVPQATAVADDGTVWLAALGGVFSSTDQGETWSPADLSGAGGFNVLFTDVAVRGDEIWAVSLLADSLLPGSHEGLLSGTVFVSQDGGASWRQETEALPVAAPTSVSLEGSEVCVGSLDQGTWCRRGDRAWGAAGGPVDPVGLDHADGLLVAASATAGPWVRQDGVWSAVGSAGPVAALDGGTALTTAGTVFTLQPGAPGDDLPEGGGTVHVALSFHVNYYHSYRGDSNDEDGYGKDIRVLRTILDWLDAHPGVRADWDIDNAFTLDGWMAEDSPDVRDRIASRVAAGTDDVRILSWNNGAMASSTREEFDEAVVRAQESLRDAFVRAVPGVQPQECMISPDHLGWYAEQDVQWVSLFYSATGFTALREELELTSDALYSVHTLVDEQTGGELDWVPVYHHGDLFDHGGLRGWVQQIRQTATDDRLLALHFDGDAESWENFDQEIDAVQDLVEEGGLVWTTLDAYYDDHEPLNRYPLVGDVADGTGDGFQSWGEKDFNHEVFTNIAVGRESVDRALFLRPDDAGVRDGADAALEPRLLALSTTHFGLAAPYLAEDRVASAQALSGEARERGGQLLDLAVNQWREETPPEPGSLVLHNHRDAAGLALVETELRVPQREWIGETALAVWDEDGTELAVHVGPPRASSGDYAIPVSFVVAVEARSTHWLTWDHRAEGDRATGGLSETSVPEHPAFSWLEVPFTECDGQQQSAAADGGPPPLVDNRGARATSAVEYAVPFCEVGARAAVDRSRFAGLDGLVVTVNARLDVPEDPTLAESVALTPVSCGGPAAGLSWQTFGGTVRERPMRAGVETWNGQSVDGWVALHCEGGPTLQVSHRVEERTSLAFAPVREQGGKAVMAPLGTLWGDSPWHDSRRTGGLGVGDVVTALVGAQYRPAAPDWSGKDVRYRLLLGEDLDPGTLDLFAHPPLVLVGPAPD